MQMQMSFASAFIVSLFKARRDTGRCLYIDLFIYAPKFIFHAPFYMRAKNYTGAKVTEYIFDEFWLFRLFMSA